MAYENGKRINRYAAQRKHDRILKKKFTPLRYGSYDNYYEKSKRREEEPVYRYGTYIFFQPRTDGQRAGYEKWWEQYSDPWKADLKNSSHRESRKYNRELCNLLISLIDADDYDRSFQCRFGDPWLYD